MTSSTSDHAYNAERAASWDMWLKMAEDPVELEPAPADDVREAANGAGRTPHH